MFKKSLPSILLGFFAICLPLEMFGQWSTDPTNKNVYLSDGNYKVLFNNLTYSPGALGYKLDVRGGISASIDVTAPRFQDSNNAGYYLDPTSNSNLWDVTIYNSFKSSSLVDRDNNSFYVDPASNSNLNTLGVSGTTTLGSSILLNSSASLGFTNGTSGGNGAGSFSHGLGGFTMTAAGYGSDLPHPGGSIKLYGGVSENYEGGDIILDAGSGLTRNGMIFIDKSNISSIG